MATPARRTDRVIRLVVVMGLLLSTTGFSVPRSSAVSGVAQSATVPLGSAETPGTPEASPTPEPGTTPDPGVTPQPSETPDLSSTAVVSTTTPPPAEMPSELPIPTETQAPQPAPSVADLIPDHLPILSASQNPTDDSESAVIPRAGGAVAFMRGRVTLIAQADTFGDDVSVTFTPESAASAAGQPVSATTRTISTTSGMQIVPAGPEDAPLRFRLEASRVADGRPVKTFAQPVQLVVDLRGLAGVAAGPGWYLAYRDPTDPTVWHKLEVTAHDPAGLLSAETAHFSSWVSGAEPGRWHFRWNPPAVSTFSGAATYRYPIEAPPGRNGLAPNVDLSYSSRGVDSHILSNMDQGPLGLGWSINQVEISRDSVFVDCWEDHCDLVHPDSFSLALNGESYQLKPEGSTSAAVVRYYAHNGPDLFAQRIYSATASGANPDRFYWVVKTPDGTTYRLGYTSDAESGQSTWPGNPNTAGHVGYSSNYSGIRWRVDTVTDVYGNQMQYTYAASSFGDNYSSESGSTLQVTSGARLPADIRYNYANRAPNPDTRVTGNYASQIVFVATGDNRISDIQVYHFDLVTPQRVVKLGLGGTRHDTCGQSILTNFVSSIREQTASGALTLPATTFTHTPLAHGTTGCFIYEHVRQVDNGYGGRVRFSYLDDDRRDRSGAPIPAYGRSYYVTRSETWDGLSTPAAVVDYQYATPCYDQLDGNLGNLPGAFNCPVHEAPPGSPYGHSPLIGFAQATVATKDYAGQVLGQAVSQFWQEYDRLGRAWREQAQDAAGATLQQTDTAYVTATHGTTAFTYARAVTQTTQVGGPSRATLITYTHDSYGNRTAQFEYGDTVPDGDERRTLWTYTVNPVTTTWIVNKPAQEWVYTGLSGGLAAQTRYFYDNQPLTNSLPISGALTRVERWDGSQWLSATRTAYDAWGNPTVVTNGLGYTATTSYDSAYRLYPLVVTNAKNHTTTYQYYGVNGVPANGQPAGLLKSASDPNGATTTYSYDGLGRLLKVVRPADTDALPTTSLVYADPTPATLYPNGDFEADTGWFKGGHDDENLSWGYAAGQGRSGRALQLTRLGGGDHWVGNWYAGWQAEQSYLLGGWLRGSGGVCLNVLAVEGGNELSVACATATANWQYLSGWVSLPSDANQFLALWRPTGAAGTTLYLDDMAIGPPLRPFKAETWQREVSGCSGCVRPTFEFYDGLGRQAQTRAETLNSSQQAVSNLVYDARGLQQAVYAPAFESYTADFARPAGWDTRPRTAYQYDALGRTTVITAPDGTTTSHSYGLDTSCSGVCTPTEQWRRIVVDANGHAKHYVQDGYGRLSVMRELSGTVAPRPVYAETRYAYDTLGNLVRVTDTLTNTTVITYNPLGQKTGMLDPDMGRWSYQYDAAGNLITQTDALNRAVWFKYDQLNRLIEKRQTGANGTLLAGYAYDVGANGKGRRTGMSDPVSNSVVWGYDARGRVTSESRTITGTGAFNTAFGYDALDRVITTTYPTGEVVTQTYNAASQLAEVRSSTYSLSYASGLTYNALGQLTQLSYGNGEVLRWGYWGAGGEWDTRPGNGLTSFGRLWRIRAQTGSGAPLFDSRYTYDNVGNVTRWQEAPRDASNWPTSYTFQDAFNIKDTSNWVWSAYQTVPFNDAGNNVVKSTGTAVDWSASFYRNVYSLTSGKGLQLRFKVDATNTAARFSIEADDATYRRFGVIADAGKLSVQYGDGSGWRYPADLLTSLQVNVWYVLRLVVDDTGRGFYVEAYQESNPAVRGSYTQWMPTGLSWRFRHWIWRGSAYLDEYKEFNTTGMTWSPDDRMLFTYDALDRLLSATPESGAQGYTQTFAYNPIGNITSTSSLGNYAYSASASGCAAGTPPLKPHAVSQAGSHTYTYDCNGNMLQRVELSGTQRITYTQQWNAENRLTVVTNTVSGMTTTFVYDGDGARIKKVDRNSTTVYAGAMEVLLTGTLRITKTYYSAGAQLMALRVVTSTGGNTLYYLHADHLGSTSLTTNSSGGEVARQTYYPYGAVRSGGGMPTDIGFTGQRADSNIKLIRIGARWYDPLIGRWISPDTIVPDSSNPQSLNRFGYVDNNPLRYTDPSGHCIFGLDTLVCIVLAIGGGMALGGAAYVGGTVHLGGTDIPYGVGTTLGQLPDWHGVEVANQHKAIIQGSAANAGIDDIALAAGLAVQSQWCCGAADAASQRLESDPSQGIAQLRSSEAGYFPNGVYAPFNNNASIAALAQKMKLSANACSGCSTTDRFIALGLGGNAFVGDLKRLADGSIDWNGYLGSKGEAPSLSGLGDGHVNLSEMKGLWLRARMTFGNSQVWDRFMLKVFINDLLELQRQGWNLPSNLNIPYMQCLANGDSSSCTQ